jgi:caspase domain-containing protein
MKRAFVFGSQIEGLSGVENDTTAIATMLRARDFEVDVRTGTAATRDGIITGYRALIASVAADRGAGDPAQGDAAVVYYSGHGFYGTLPGNDGAWQAIAPTDLRQGSDNDFRGITAWELSILQGKLTEQTRNVTVILDCCHSSQMSKDGATRNAVSRSLAHPMSIGLAAHIDQLQATYGTLPTLDPLGNPHAVRLVAAAQNESAFEYRTASGAQHGVFTESLLDVFKEVGASEVSWGAIGDAVRARVLQSFASQRPDVEGPRDRITFSLNEVNTDGVITIRVAGDQLELAGGRLTGITDGDVYGVMPVGASRHDPARAIAEVEVSKLLPLAARLKVRAWMNGHQAMPVDAVAIPLTRAAARRPIALAGSGPRRAALEQAIAGHKLLRIASDGEAALGTLQLDGDRLTLSDSLGALFPPATLTDEPAELGRMVHNAANLARAQAVRELAGEHEVYNNEIRIELGVVDNGSERPLRDRPALGLRDRFYIKVTNTGYRQLHVHVLNIGLQSTVDVLTANFAPSGILLQGGASYVLGKHPNGTLMGVGIGWPDGLPRDGFPRLDEYMVMATSSPVNLGALQAQAKAGRKAQGGKLLDLMSQQQDGASRDARLGEQIEGFLARKVAFDLYPHDARIGGVAFNIDENPTGQAALRVAAAWGATGARGDGARFEPAAPDAIAIRLLDLVVERNRALWSTDVRVDALICTRAEDGRAGHTTWTQKFSGINDGERVPLDQATLFLGPARDFVDITLFVSRDTRPALDLAGLFAQRANSLEFQQAAAALLVAAGATGSPWVAAVGASAVLARMAYELVLGVAGTSIGLYRTSFLRHEQFGVGRHPAERLYRAQDFSFALQVEPVQLQTSGSAS